MVATTFACQKRVERDNGLGVGTLKVGRRWMPGTVAFELVVCSLVAVVVGEWQRCGLE